MRQSLQKTSSGGAVSPVNSGAFYWRGRRRQPITRPARNSCKLPDPNGRRLYASAHKDTQMAPPYEHAISPRSDHVSLASIAKSCRPYRLAGMTARLRVPC